MKITAGVDEVGRGPLAGPVLAAAVILDPANMIDGLRDSKKLTEKKRIQLCEIIKKQAKCWAIGMATVEEIDQINILQASLLAMKRAVESLIIQPQLVLVDGNICPKIAIKTQAIVGGDDLIPEISAASIIAKVTRDELMIQLDKKHPEYGFANHKGYSTAEHLRALQSHGATAHHRQSFSPVKEVMID